MPQQDYRKRNAETHNQNPSFAPATKKVDSTVCIARYTF